MTAEADTSLWRCVLCGSTTLDPPTLEWLFSCDESDDGHQWVCIDRKDMNEYMENRHGELAR